MLFFVLEKFLKKGHLKMKKKLIIWIVILVILLVIVDVLYFTFSSAYTPNPKLKSNINRQIYIAPYVGDFDGEVAEEWYPFYKRIIDFHEENKIPVTFSFYPYSIQNDSKFNSLILRMYNSEYIELMQKGYKGDDRELAMERLSYEEQRAIIKAGQDHFRAKMQELTGNQEIEVPKMYNLIGAEFTEDTKRAAQSLGFNFYFDVYVGDRTKAVNSTDDFFITEYGVSFTKDGDAGRENEFKTSDEIFEEINGYTRRDVNVLTLNGKEFIPLWSHQQDFESMLKENKLDKDKWERYTTVLEALKNDPNVTLITPEEFYRLSHLSNNTPSQVISLS